MPSNHLPAPPKGPTRWLALLVVLILTVLAMRGAPITVEQARQHLIQWEGYHLTPYRDGSSWSVGIGHNLTAHGEVKRPRYSHLEVQRMFLKDLAWSLDALRKSIRAFDDLPQDVQLVALSVVWTTGRTGFNRFTSFRRALSYRAFNGAAHELALSRWAKQVSPSRRDHHVRVLLRKQ